MEQVSEQRGLGLAGLLATAAWGIVVAVAFGLLMVYGNTRGAAGVAPERWPAVEGLELDGELATLVLFAHPRCPCTRASLNELERLVAQVDARLAVTVAVYRPEGAEPAWSAGANREAAARVPGVTIVPDEGGRLARRFGAATSGHVVVYEPSGALVFSGGITAARAHEGDNRGRDAIRHFVNAGEVVESRTAVFGCDLFDEACGPANGGGS